MYLAGPAVSADAVTPGLLGFTVFALLGLALFLLVRSMNKHLRRVNVPGDPRDPKDDGRADKPRPPAQS